MANVTVTVLGLGRIGASVALALRRYNEGKDARHTFEVTCTDLRAGVREDATKVGLGDKIERDLFSSTAKRDIVVLALPLAETWLRRNPILCPSRQKAQNVVLRFDWFLEDDFRAFPSIGNRYGPSRDIRTRNCHEDTFIIRDDECDRNQILVTAEVVHCIVEGFQRV